MLFGDTNTFGFVSHPGFGPGAQGVGQGVVSCAVPHVFGFAIDLFMLTATWFVRFASLKYASYGCRNVRRVDEQEEAMWFE